MCSYLELLLYDILQFLAINGLSCGVCELECSVMDESEDANYMDIVGTEAIPNPSI